MFAVVETSGRQYRVEPGATIRVDRMKAEEGTTITLDRVLLVSGDEILVGAPTVAGAKVTATVVAHPRGAKVTTLKYRRRHRMKRKVGFRASHTDLKIEGIELK